MESKFQSDSRRRRRREVKWSKKHFWQSKEGDEMTQKTNK